MWGAQPLARAGPGSRHTLRVGTQTENERRAEGPLADCAPTECPGPMGHRDTAVGAQCTWGSGAGPSGPRLTLPVCLLWLWTQGGWLEAWSRVGTATPGPALPPLEAPAGGGPPPPTVGARASATACACGPEEGGVARPGPGLQASGGGLPYLQVLPPHVHSCKGQLHLFPACIFVPLVGDLNEDQEDAGHDAPGHQHEDPWGPKPRAQLQAERLRPPRSEARPGERGPPAMFSKVRVAGALLRESHSWYRTHVLSRSSMKPFSWDLRGGAA